MMNDLENQPDLSEDEEEDNKSLNNSDHSSDLSLSPPPPEEQEEEEEEEENKQNDDRVPELHDEIDENLHINENKDEDELTQFITKARQQGFNCLDLSKRNITEFPSTLLEFPSLQVNFT
jgi:hypothetical protein